MRAPGTSPAAARTSSAAQRADPRLSREGPTSREDRAILDQQQRTEKTCRDSHADESPSADSKGLHDKAREVLVRVNADTEQEQEGGAARQLGAQASPTELVPEKGEGLQRHGPTDLDDDDADLRYPQSGDEDVEENVEYPGMATALEDARQKQLPATPARAEPMQTRTQAPAVEIGPVVVISEATVRMRALVERVRERARMEALAEGAQGGATL